MLAVMNQFPKFCPGCGKPIDAASFAKDDFFAGAASGCKCGCSICYTPTEPLLELASRHGDIGRYETVRSLE